MIQFPVFMVRLYILVIIESEVVFNQDRIKRFKHNATGCLRSNDIRYPGRSAAGNPGYKCCSADFRVVVAIDLGANFSPRTQTGFTNAPL